ncbi:MAG: DUF309 domain-containing protein [Isosphaeraceae bacterium]|nr:DUF309 domain-containing protein [Isosphaeraceae bacterium]
MDLPPYTYIPGGRHPHPIREPGGHMHGRRHEQPPPIADELGGTGSPAFDQGKRLFEAGYYWEAHEAWESLWHAHGRTGPTADLLKGLIKLAAAGVKVREGQPHGVRVHAARAGDLFRAVRAAAGDRVLGLDLEHLIASARVAEEVVAAPGLEPDGAAVAVFPFRLER